jgi:predicted NBD/HSP70 family sugar kinase
MRAAIDDLVTGADIDPAAVLGVGIASPGPIDPEAGVVLDPPFLPRWRDVPLREALAEATGYGVLLEKDVTAAAVGEMFLAGEGVARNFAFVYYGTGFGVGLVLDHEPVRGVSSNAGDAGHIIVEQGGLADTGLEARGEVGETVAPERLVALGTARGLDLGAGATPDVAGVDRAWTRLSALLDADDPVAVGLATEAGAVMGRAAVVIVNLLDIDRVVFGGPFWSRISAAALPEATRTITGSPVLAPKHPVVVVESDRGQDVAAVGAACLVLDAAMSPRASSLLIRR